MNLWEPYLKENIQDPYKMYKRLRDEAPIYQASNGDYIITRYEHVKEVLASNNFHTGVRLDWLESHTSQLDKYNLKTSALKEAMEAFLLFINPPNHTRIRGFISRVWDDRDIDTHIKGNIDKLLQSCHGTFDFIDSYAKPLPTMTISSILGISQEETLALKSKTDHFFKLLDVYVSLKELRSILECVKELTDFLKNTIEEKKEKKDSGLISKIIEQNKKEKNLLTDTEVMSVCFLLFSGGTETSIGLIGNGMLALLQHEKVIKQLRADPSLWDNAIEEILRYDAPAQLSVRKTVKDFKIDKFTISANSTVVVSMGSANRDESKFDKSDQFRLERSKNPHLSFGGGRHYCLGDWLGRKQTNMALQAFIQKFSQIDMNGDYEFNKNITIRSLKCLPLIVS